MYHMLFSLDWPAPVRYECDTAAERQAISTALNEPGVWLLMSPDAPMPEEWQRRRVPDWFMGNWSHRDGLFMARTRAWLAEHGTDADNELGGVGEHVPLPPDVVEVAKSGQKHPATTFVQALQSSRSCWLNKRINEMRGRAADTEEFDALEEAMRANPFSNQHKLFPYRRCPGPFKDNYDAWWNTVISSARHLVPYLTRALSQGYEVTGSAIMDGLRVRLKTDPLPTGDEQLEEALVTGMLGRSKVSRKLSMAGMQREAEWAAAYKKLSELGVRDAVVDVTIDATPNGFDNLGHGQADIERTCFRATREYDCAPIILGVEDNTAVVQSSIYGVVFARSVIVFKLDKDKTVEGAILFNSYPSDGDYRSTLHRAAVQTVLREQYGLTHHREMVGAPVGNRADLSQGYGVFINKTSTIFGRAGKLDFKHLINNNPWLRHPETPIASYYRERQREADK